MTPSQSDLLIAWAHRASGCTRHTASAHYWMRRRIRQRHEDAAKPRTERRHDRRVLATMTSVLCESVRSMPLLGAWGSPTYRPNRPKGANA